MFQSSTEVSEAPIGHPIREGLERLRVKLHAMSEDGLINIKFTPGPAWANLSHDEKCGALADFLEAEKTQMAGPQHSGKPKVDIRELVRRGALSDDR